MAEQNLITSGRLEDRVGTEPLRVNVAVRDKTHVNMRDFHYHSTYELFYVKDGSVDFVINNENYNIVGGSLLVIPPFVAHRSVYTNTVTTSRFEVSVNSSFLEFGMQQLLQKLSGHISYTVSLKYQDRIIRLLTSLKEEEKNAREYSHELCLAYLHEFLILLYRFAVPSVLVGQSHKVLPQKMMEYISQNYHRNITVAELAEKFHICESSVYKNFKQHTGLKITDYLNFTRVMHAERLMRESDYTLSEIAYRCGFNDSNYFSAVFKKYKNITPGKYRRKYRE